MKQDACEDLPLSDNVQYRVTTHGTVITTTRIVMTQRWRDAISRALRGQTREPQEER